VTQVGGGGNPNNVVFHDVNLMIEAIEKVNVYLFYLSYAIFLGTGNTQRHHQQLNKYLLM
jgi:hypothetical protein